MPKPRVIGQPKTAQHFSLGIDALADLLAPTLGPIGGVVANERNANRKPEILDDSATSMRRILNMGDPRMDVGAMLLRSTVWRVVQRSGDGGAMTAILMRAIHREGRRMIAAGANAMVLARGINMAVEAAVESLLAQARPVSTEDDLAAVAATVIRDPELATVLGEMSYLLGPEAHVNIEKFVAPYLQQFYYPGANYKAKIASMYLYTDETQRQAILPDGMIALVDGKLDKVEDIVPIIEVAKKNDAKSLTVVAGNFSDEVIGVMVANSRRPGQTDAAGQNGGSDQQEKPKDRRPKPTMVITGATPKDVGDARRAVFDDLAMLTGATVAGRAWGIRPSSISDGDLGWVARSEVSKDMLHVVPKQTSPEVRAKAEELRTRLANMTLDDDDRPGLQQRLAAMSGGMGVLKIGADSKLDREVQAQNAERALKVLSAAQRSGVVPGAGAALFHAIPALDGLETTGDATFGVEIVRRALAAPSRQIFDNAHVPSSSVILEKIREAGPAATYDVFSATVVDAYEAGVVDVAEVLKTVLQTAASGAVMALTTDTIVYHKKPEQAISP